MKNSRNMPLLHAIANIAGLAMFCGIFVVSLASILGVKKDIFFLLAAVAPAICFFFIIRFCGRIKNEKTFIFILVSVAFIMRLVWVLTVDTSPESDFLILYNAGLKGAAGDFSFNSETYFLMWPYQMGFSLYQSLVLLLFGGGTLALKILNCLITTGTTLLVYKTGKLLFGRSSGKIASIMYTLYVPAIIMNSLLSNQQLSTFLFYLGFYIMLKQFERKKFSWLFTGLLFALGHVIRPLAIVVIPGVLLYQFVYAICMKNKNRMVIIRQTVLALIVFFISFQAVSLVLEMTGISPYGFQNRDPLWKFVTGLNSQTSGQYSEPDIEYLKQFPLGSEGRKGAEMDLIRERTRDPGRLVSLMGKKYSIFWGTKDAFTYWTLGPNHPTLSKTLGPAEQLTYLAAVFFGALALVRLLRKRMTKHSFFIILMLLYAGAHLFIEIQTRYREFVIPIIFMFFGYGINTCYIFIKSRMRRKARI